MLTLISAVIQSAEAGIFFAFFLKTDNRFRASLLVTLIFLIVLDLISLLTPYRYALWMNLVNELILYIGLCLIFKEDSRLRILLAVGLNLLVGLLSDAFLQMLSAVVFHVHHTSDSIQPFLTIFDPYLSYMRFLGGGLYALNLWIVVRIFSPVHSTRLAPILAAIGLVFSGTLSFFCGVRMSLVYPSTYTIQQYILISLVILFFIGISLWLLIQETRKSLRINAMLQIEEEYHQQLENYLREENNEQQLRQFRHDVLNFLYSQKLVEDKQDLAQERLNDLWASFGQILHTTSPTPETTDSTPVEGPSSSDQKQDGK